MTSTGTDDAAQPTALFTVDDLSRRWQVGRSRIYRMARDGKLPAMRIDRCLRFEPSAITAYEAGNRGEDE